jgi:hypothetical protein
MHNAILGEGWGLLGVLQRLNAGDVHLNAIVGAAIRLHAYVRYSLQNEPDIQFQLTHYQRPVTVAE